MTKKIDIPRVQLTRSSALMVIIILNLLEWLNLSGKSSSSEFRRSCNSELGQMNEKKLQVHWVGCIHCDSIFTIWGFLETGIFPMFGRWFIESLLNVYFRRNYYGFVLKYFHSSVPSKKNLYNFMILILFYDFYEHNSIY